LPEAGPVRLTIYDILGRKVRTLINQKNHPLGYYSLTWDGNDKVGRPVGNGVFFYRLETPAFTRAQKMTLIK
jgi:flagellar hook assembly protein FlgD